MSSEGFSESDSLDIEIQSAFLKKPQKEFPTNATDDLIKKMLDEKFPNSPSDDILKKMLDKKSTNSPSDDLLKKKLDKKLPTKIMIHQALIDLKSRKGASLYAIKKYIAERYNVDTEKLNYHIKKFIKSAVEEGSIIQTKGIGATGSFKLAHIKEKKPKTKKAKKEKTEKMKDPEKKKKLKEKSKKTEGKSLKSKLKSKGSNEDKPDKPKKKIDAEKKPKEKINAEKKPKEKKDAKKKPKEKKDAKKKPKEKKDDGEKTKIVRIAKGIPTPSKKKGTMKRKSIGSIIKPPKMNPTAKADRIFLNH